MDLLKDLTILDFTRLLPGPLATHLLAQMGARVIKVEHPRRMDYARYSGPPVEGQSTLFRALNHNKEFRSIAYDTAGGKAEIAALIRESDALIEQFRPGAMESWGFGYAAAKDIREDVVYVSLTGYGQTGPMAPAAGHDLNYLALSGLLSLTKDESGKPVVPGFQLADIGAGAYLTAMSCLAALVHRMKTGKGKWVDVSMADGVLPLLTVPMSLLWGGLDPAQFNFLDGKTTVNYAVYACADGKWISVGAVEIRFWNEICELVGKPEWRRNNELELFNQQFPKHEVEALFRTRSRDAWALFFEGKDVCVAPVLELHELENHAHWQAHNAFETLHTGSGKTYKTFALPFRVQKD
jgi:crotonobetainyl-CoA:carnitine CoA-transferase CaiB-like acyl-CoA transferase